MSTLKATNLQHASAASPNIVLDSAGKVTFGGAVAGAGMDLITPTSVAGTGVTVSGGAGPNMVARWEASCLRVHAAHHRLAWGVAGADPASDRSQSPGYRHGIHAPTSRA